MIALASPDLLLTAARQFGWPRVEVRVAGRRWPVPIDPEPESWARFVAWFGTDPASLEAALVALVMWECRIRADLATPEHADA
jgi:hypothetical protein